MRNPWDNPAHYFEDVYYPMPISYYEGLNLCFGPRNKEPMNVRYIIGLEVGEIAATTGGGMINVRFWVLLPGYCPNESQDDCYHDYEHEPFEGESSVDVPLALLRKIAKEQLALSKRTPAQEQT
ncbi:MAG: hypothetical protein AAB554_01215 [Patescibacteria group bacterium]